MKVLTKRISVISAVVLVVLSISLNVYAADKIRIALGDVASVETLCFLVALDRAKDRGLDYEMTAFAKEQLAIQAVIGGQMDLAVGHPLLDYPEKQGVAQEHFSVEQTGVLSCCCQQVQDLERPER